MEGILWFSGLISLSIALEASAYPKPGNVHRLSSRSDLLYEDFIATSIAVNKWITYAIVRGYNNDYTRNTIGDIVYYGLRDSMKLTGGGNTCLGSLLLLSPLALSVGRLLKEQGAENPVVDTVDLAEWATRLVSGYSTVEDSVMFYSAVRLASPSYIRREDDTGDLPNVWDEDYEEKLVSKGITLWRILLESSRRDMVSDEIVKGYKRSLKAKELIKEFFRETGDWNLSVVKAFIYILAENPDTLIQRKHGPGEAYYVMMRAKEIRELIMDDNPKWIREVEELDKELSSRGINPGSTADIITSSIALYLLEKKENIFSIRRDSGSKPFTVT